MRGIGISGERDRGRTGEGEGAREIGLALTGTTPRGRGLHSLTSQLKLNAFYGIEGARMGCVARNEGVIGGV